MTFLLCYETETDCAAVTVMMREMMQYIQGEGTIVGKLCNSRRAYLAKANLFQTSSMVFLENCARNDYIGNKSFPKF